MGPATVPLPGKFSEPAQNCTPAAKSPYGLPGGRARGAGAAATGIRRVAGRVASMNVAELKKCLEQLGLPAAASTLERHGNGGKSIQVTYLEFLSDLLSSEQAEQWKALSRHPH